MKLSRTSLIFFDLAFLLAFGTRSFFAAFVLGTVLLVGLDVSLAETLATCLTEGFAAVFTRGLEVCFAADVVAGVNVLDLVALSVGFAVLVLESLSIESPLIVMNTINSLYG